MLLFEHSRVAHAPSTWGVALSTFLRGSSTLFVAVVHGVQGGFHRSYTEQLFYCSPGCRVATPWSWDGCAVHAHWVRQGRWGSPGLS